MQHGPRRGVLISPEGWELTPGNARAQQLLRSQLKSYQEQMAVMKFELERKWLERDFPEEQPYPDQWEWIPGEAAG